MAFEAAHFLNLDLDVQGSEPLAPLTAALSSRAFALHDEFRDGRATACYELDGSGLVGCNNESCDAIPNDPESLIRAFCSLLEQLPPGARTVWDRADLRDFNLGLQGGLEPHCQAWPITTESLTRVAALGARVVITLYAADDDSLRGPGAGATPGQRVARGRSA